ncbi:hypothetical protein Q8G35_02080 [Peribacillus simplex]|uniref:Uncharacterized protein n=2 Tax=Peribacillus TaxID=2675229 RepID=A0AA90PCX5_9BACI|nr:MULTISPECIES: hypothetical protein [Peribacillus]MDP1417190.1 hypothetical protein [Peribacillus simplex]MDP1449845.1 hypothetical protein [Peribacillus frigoritolerans]
MLHIREKRFALDIGTRSVVGIILEIEQESYNLIDILSQGHWTMIDRLPLAGAIHE